MAKKRFNGKTKAELTKQLIFESALTLFKEKGFDPVSIEQITKYAGTSKGSFYTYFSTKSDIIVEEFWAIDAYYRGIEEVALRIFLDVSFIRSRFFAVSSIGETPSYSMRWTNMT
jgi:AcrR family transcriptional regulator